MTLTSFLRRISVVSGVAAIAMISAPISAESVAVEITYPAENANAAKVHSLAVDRLGGAYGEDVSFAIEKALQGAIIDGERYFQIFGDDRDVEAILTGDTTARVAESEAFEDRTNCLKYDEQEACIESEKYKVKCLTKNATLNSTIRLETAVDRRVIYSSKKTEQARDYSCSGESTPARDEEMYAPLVDKIAASVRLDIAPRQRVSQIDIQERQKGLPRNQRKAFKAAIKLTKSDDNAACAAFTDLYALAPQARSAIYNAALCAERAGDYTRAVELYRIAEPMYSLSGSADLGIRRATGSGTARSQLDARAAAAGNQ